MSMAQEGNPCKVDMNEGDGVIAGGGAIEQDVLGDPFRVSETIVLGETKCLSETFNRVESVVITNV